MSGRFVVVLALLLVLILLPLLLAQTDRQIGPLSLCLSPTTIPTHPPTGQRTRHVGERALELEAVLALVQLDDVALGAQLRERGLGAFAVGAGCVMCVLVVCKSARCDTTTDDMTSHQ